MSDQQQAVNEVVAQFKQIIMMLLNETADEFDERELTDEQRQIYNDFTGAFGKKVLEIQLKVNQ